MFAAVSAVWRLRRREMRQEVCLQQIPTDPIISGFRRGRAVHQLRVFCKFSCWLVFSDLEQIISAQMSRLELSHAFHQQADEGFVIMGTYSGDLKLYNLQTAEVRKFSFLRNAEIVCPCCACFILVNNSSQSDKHRNV